MKKRAILVIFCVLNLSLAACSGISDKCTDDDVRKQVLQMLARDVAAKTNEDPFGLLSTPDTPSPDKSEEVAKAIHDIQRLIGDLARAMRFDDLARLAKEGVFVHLKDGSLLMADGSTGAEADKKKRYGYNIRNIITEKREKMRITCSAEVLLGGANHKTESFSPESQSSIRYEITKAEDTGERTLKLLSGVWRRK